MFRLLSLFSFLFSISLCSQEVSGTVTDEDQNPISAVLVFNMKTEQKVYTTLNGEFTIAASSNHELRFIKNGFERSSKILNAQDFRSPLSIIIVRSVQEIEEVKIPAIRLTGDLQQDSRNLTRFDKVAQLRREVGAPAPPEKPRETPADFKNDVLLPLLGLSLKPQAIYNLISGDARRKKAQYRYDDLQDNILWIRRKVGDDYFVKMEIPAERISEFLQFSIGLKPEIKSYIKAQNLSKVLFMLEDTLPLYLRQ